MNAIPDKARQPAPWNASVTTGLPNTGHERLPVALSLPPAPSS